MRNTHAALAWIVDILHKENVSFEIDGGLAAELYGVKRELADIDINVAEKDFDRIVPHVKDYLIYGPQQYEDDHWKVYMMTLSYAGQHVDVGTLESMRYFDTETKEWMVFPADLSSVRTMSYSGIEIPVINEMKLMIYKQELARGVDRKDVEGMEEQLLDSGEHGTK